MRFDRCPTCGGKPLLWSPDQIIEAVRAFADEHGRPPTIREWHTGTPTNPSYSTVVYMFGSWRALMWDAGFNPNEAPIVWTRERIADAFVDWRVRYGRWPTARDWAAASDENPCAATVIARFGSWNRGRRSAGYTGSPRAQHLARASLAAV